MVTKGNRQKIRISSKNCHCLGSSIRAWGHPLRGPCQEEKTPPRLEKVLSFLTGATVELTTSLPLPSFLWVFGVSPYCTSHPSGFGSCCENWFFPPRPFPLEADQKIFGSMSCPNGFSQILWLLASPLVAHDMGSKDADNSLLWVERITNQASVVIIPTPIQVHRSSQFLIETVFPARRQLDPL